MCAGRLNDNDTHTVSFLTQKTKKKVDLGGGRGFPANITEKEVDYIAKCDSKSEDESWNEYDDYDIKTSDCEEDMVEDDW